jgi:hypothetical protein
VKKKKRRSELDRGLHALMKAYRQVQRTLVPDTALSSRYTAEMRRDFARGEEAGKRLAKKWFG